MLRSAYVNMKTLADIEAEIREAYRNATGAPSGRRQTTGGALNLRVGQPAALMLRAVEIAGADGITLQELRRLFGPMGKDRYDEALRALRSQQPLVREESELRPNRSGRPQRQVVLRPIA